MAGIGAVNVTYSGPTKKAGVGKAAKAAHSTNKAWNAAKGVWEELKHPRDGDGKFASKPGAPNAPKLKSPAKKTAAPKVKGHKPDYVPPVWAKIKGTNAKADGHKLYTAKAKGQFKNDHEMYLAAAKYAALYKKVHPNDSNAASANGIYNAALRYEIDYHGKHTMLPQLGAAEKVPEAHVPKEPSYHRGKTPGGVGMSSKFLAPGHIKPTGKTMQGVSGAQVYEDNNGNQWLVKFPGGSKGTSKAYSSNKFLVDLDIATSRIQNKGGLPVPSIHGAEVDGKYASVHKMYSRAKDAFPSNTVDLSKMSKEDVLEIQKSMVLDWLISNHDAHTGNFLKTDKGIIGIDKGQAFKYFGKDKLTPKFGSDLNPPLAPNKPVYSTLMASYIDGKGELASFDEGELAAMIQRLQAIPDDEYKSLLRPYAEQAAAQGLLSYAGKSPDHDKDDQVTVFLAQATKRKNNLASDFANLQKQLDDEKALKATAVNKQGEHKLTKLTDLKVGDTLEHSHWGAVTVVSTNVAHLDDGYVKVKTEDGQFGNIKQFNIDNGTVIMPSPPKTSVTAHKPGEHITDLSKVKAGDGVDLFDAEDGTWTPVKVSEVGPDGLVVTFHDGTSTIIDELVEFNEEGNEVFKVQWHDESWGPAVGTASPTSSVPDTTSYDQLNQVLQSHPKMAQGYKIESHPNIPGKVGIKKPSGEWSQSLGGEIKSWDNGNDALNSSTMAKYKTQAAQKSQQHMSMVQTQATNAAELDVNNPPFGITPEQATQFNALKAKLMAGQHTSGDYMEFKALQVKIASAKKAKGAAHIIETPATQYVPIIEPNHKPAVDKKKLGGMSWKGKGGAPTPFDKIPGPQAKEMGLELWERKQKGEFENVYDLYKAANQLSNKQKKEAQKANPGKKLESSVDYSTANAIRNAALRHEFDATGTVSWETKAEKTSGSVKQTAKETKHVNELHAHVPIHETHKTNPSSITKMILPSAISDPSKPVGSYENPHAFVSSGYGTTEMYDFGKKYTSTSGWNSAQHKAFYSFTGSGSSQVNPYLRTGEPPQYTSKVYLDAMIANMDAAFDAPQVKPLDDWTLVSRGTSGGWEFGIPSDNPSLADFQSMVGKTLQNKAYISSSIGYPPAFASNSIHITYKLPPGFRGIFCGNSSSMTSHTGEREWILPRNLQYKVLEAADIDGKTHITLEVVGVGKK